MSAVSKTRGEKKLDLQGPALGKKAALVSLNIPDNFSSRNKDAYNTRPRTDPLEGHQLVSV